MSVGPGMGAFKLVPPVAFALLAAGIPVHAQSPSAAPAPVVTVATLKRQNVAPSHRFIGHVASIQSVKIVPRVTAFIEQEPVKQGSTVHSGDVLFRLQTTQYEAALKSAQSQLASAQAALKNDQVAYERSAKLNQQGFEAQANLDSAAATRDQAQAAVEGAQAAVTQAQLNLDYCTIRSPIDGRIGAVTLTKGNLVTPGSQALATVNQLDPIRVVFSVATTDVRRVLHQSGWALTDATKALTVTLHLPDGTAYPDPGAIAFFGNEVDPQTGTVPAYADFANSQAQLLPGECVSVSVRSSEPEEKLLAPVAAVQTNQHGHYVLVVGSDDKVSQRAVTLGPQIAEDYVVKNGLSEGERVIVVGVQKVHSGEVVRPVEAPAPAEPEAQSSPSANTASQAQPTGDGG